MSNRFVSNVISVTLTSLLLSACSEQTPAPSPAEEQIKTYTKELEECREKNGKSNDAKGDQPKNSTESATGLKDSGEKLSGQATPEGKEVLRERDFFTMPDDITLGNPEANVTMVQYFSPTCPHCVIFHQKIYPEIKKNYIDTGKVVYIIRELIVNKQDLDASILARCKKDKDSYLKFVDVILKRQESWAYEKNYRDILTDIGKLGGLSEEEYTKCLNDGELLKTLSENTKLAVKVPNLIGSPSFFINGKLYTKPYSFEEISKALDEVTGANDKEGR